MLFAAYADDFDALTQRVDEIANRPPPAPVIAHSPAKKAPAKKATTKRRSSKRRRR